MTKTLADIRQTDNIRLALPTRFIVDEPPDKPDTMVVHGQQGLIRVQWSPVLGVDGYDVAVMTDQNLGAPDINIERQMGDKNREFSYQTGNASITRYFSVRAFKSGYFSDWLSPVAGTSAVFGAPESPPPTSPAVPPSSAEVPPSGSNLAGSRGRTVL